MKRPARTVRPLRTKALAQAVDGSSLLKGALIAGAALAAATFAADRASADAALCSTGECTAEVQPTAAAHYFRYSTALPGAQTVSGLHTTQLSDQDFSSFSGIGMIVCTVDGVSRASTAFLVGAFDIAVTVAHTFATKGDEEPHCVYNSMDSSGQVRERIPVSYIKSQWETEPGASGELAKDLAVVRLTQPSRYAQRTMPLGRFSGDAASVVMVGFKEATYSDTFKLKKRGRVYDEAIGPSPSPLGAFTHDMDSLHIAAGAPVIDERTGVIIGIHTRIESESTQNTMITMNDWLEQTLRSEMQAGDEKGANSNL